MAVNKWLFKKIRSVNNERMNKHLDILVDESGKSRSFIKFDIIRNFIVRGSGYTDYFRGNYINLTKAEKETFVTAKKFYNLLEYLNDSKYKVLLNDKLVFNRFFKEFLKRDYINLKESSVKEFEEFLREKEIVFAKVPIGEGGHGVSKIRISDYKDIKKLYNELISKGQFLVEEAIKQSDELNEINPNVVNSFRVITLYKDGKVYLVNNAIRINQDEMDVIGCTNDLYCSLNENGTIDSNVIDDYGHVYQEHPLTGKKFKEVKIKGVKEAFLMCQEAHLRVPQIRYIGWDVAFTNNGPVLVEGNEYPGYGIIQFYKLKNSRTGHLKEIADILGDEINNIKL